MVRSAIASSRRRCRATWPILFLKAASYDETLDDSTHDKRSLALSNMCCKILLLRLEVSKLLNLEKCVIPMQRKAVPDQIGDLHKRGKPRSSSLLQDTHEPVCKNWSLALLRFCPRRFDKCRECPRRRETGTPHEKTESELCRERGPVWLHLHSGCDVHRASGPREKPRIGVSAVVCHCARVSTRIFSELACAPSWNRSWRCCRVFAPPKRPILPLVHIGVVLGLEPVRC